MAAPHLGSPTAVLALVCAAGLVSGCGDDGTRDGSSQESVSPTADTPSPTPSPTKPDPHEAACRRAERREARNIWLWQAVRDVTSAPNGQSDDARRSVAKHTAKARVRLTDTCGGRAPEAFEEFATDIDAPVAAGRFGKAELDEVLAAWLRWGTAVGAPEAARREIRDLRSCRREFFPRFDATYRTWWKWTDTGKAWWVELTFDNRTGKVLDGDMSGTARATEVLPDPFGWEQGPRPGPGKDATLSWGGSSADVLQLEPGTTTLTAAPDIDEDVHTTAGGTFRVVETTVGLQPRGERYGCAPPFRQVP